jgi:toluene methyl-monooxygenase electron transfer component
MARLKQSSGGRFTFVPVLSSEAEGSDWKGLLGLCPDFISNDLIDLSKADAYLCGPPPMIDASIDRLTSAGVAGERIFFDKFFDASTMPGGR